MNPRFLLIGKNGQIGAELAQLLPKLGETLALGRQELDLGDPPAISRAVREIRPGIIVNAAAYTAVDKAESEASLARQINADAPGVLAEEAKKIDAAVVHFSTDYVFDGRKSSPYVEDDTPNPIGVYGATKLVGEDAIRSAGIPHLIFRTAWVYGIRGHNFFRTILRLASERDELRVVNDQTGSPTWSREVAWGTVEVLGTLLEGGAERARLEGASGTYHMTAAGLTTWYGFAQAILEGYGALSSFPSWLDPTSRDPRRLARLRPVTTRDYPTPARRPLFSILSNLRLLNTFGVTLPDWKDQLRSVFGQR